MSQSHNPYEEYLEATREAPLLTLSKHFARYSLSRFTSTVFSYPWDAMIVLRQVQFDGGVSTVDIGSEAAERSAEEQRVEYERYMLNPTSSKYNYQPANVPIERDNEGYVDVPMVNSRIRLDLNKSVLHSMYSSLQLEGIYGLYQGAGAYNLKRMVADIIHDGIVPLVRDLSEESLLQEAAITAVSSVLLNPLEVAHTKLAVQSAYRNEQTFETGVYSVLKQSTWSELFSGVAYNVVARTSEIVGTAVMSQYGCALVDKLRVSSYHWLTAGYFFVNLLAMNVPLLVSIPCDTIRRRLAVSGMRSTRVPVRPDWPLSHQLQARRHLYHGLTFRIATNTAFLLINLMTELESEWLGQTDDF